MFAVQLPKGEIMDEQVFQRVVSLEQESRYAVDTATAARYLNRRPQTLRSWAALENGPIRPRRVNGRLAWCVLEIRELLKLS